MSNPVGLVLGIIAGTIVDTLLEMVGLPHVVCFVVGFLCTAGVYGNIGNDQTPF